MSSAQPSTGTTSHPAPLLRDFLDIIRCPFSVANSSVFAHPSYTAKEHVKTLLLNGGTESCRKKRKKRKKGVAVA